MYKWAISVLTCCLISGSIVMNANSFIEKSGSITENETWSENTYLITGTIFVRDDVTLTLEPGAILKFRQYTGLKVYGTLQANGSEGQKIIFTSCRDYEFGEAIPADTCDTPVMIWNGIYLEGQSGYEGIGNLDNCVIRYGGDPGGDVRANIHFRLSDSGYIRNSICEFSANNGVLIGYCSPSLENNVLAENNQIGILVELTRIHQAVSKPAPANSAIETVWPYPDAPPQLSGAASLRTDKTVFMLLEAQQHQSSRTTFF